MAEGQNKGIGIYRIENLVNGKSYIGSSLNIERRIKIHRGDLNSNASHSSKLQRAWNKYREKNFRFHILEFCCEQKLLDIEEEYIRKFDSVRNGYNACYRGRSALGVKRSKEFKEKCREAQKRICKQPGESKRRSEQVRKSFASGNRKSVRISKAESRRRSEFAKNRKISDKERKNSSRRLRKLRKTKEFNEVLNVWNRCEKKLKMTSNVMTKYWKTFKNRENASDRMKENWKNPKFRKRMILALNRRKKYK